MRNLLTEPSGPEHAVAPGQKALFGALSVLLVAGSGLAAGLTLGLLSLPPLELEVLRRSGSNRQRERAERILPMLADPHWLLVTLLLCNAACYEALPIFLDVLLAPLGAILISVTAILLFGEILPQAVCARHGLAIGAALAWLVRILMLLTAPVAWPLARALDCLLGRESHTVFRRSQLKVLVDLHGAEEGHGGGLSDQEVRIICGALDLANKIAYSAMTPLAQVVMLSTDQCIDRALVEAILASGHSRLPVYCGTDRTDVAGLLLVKELLRHVFPGPVGPGDQSASQCHGAHICGSVRVADLALRPLPRFSATTRLYDLLRLFQIGRTHMVLLTQPRSTTSVAASASPRAGRPGPNLPPSPRESQSTGTGALPEPQHLSLSRGSANEQLQSRLGEGGMPQGRHAHGLELQPAQAPPAARHASGIARLSARLAGSLHAWGSGVPSTPTDLTTSPAHPTASSSSSSSTASEVTESAEEVPMLAAEGQPIGILTMEDALEALMASEIYDETDAADDVERLRDAQLPAALAMQLARASRHVPHGLAS